jgi:class 3 adenylate cyclase
VIAFDRRGVGLSDTASDDDSLDSRAEDLQALLRAAGSNRASFVTFGEGGLAVMRLAATSPHLVGSLVLIAAYARLTQADGFPIGLAAAQLDAMVRGIEKDWGNGDWVASLLPPYATDPTFRQWACRFERYCTTPTRAAAAWRHIGSLDVRDSLAQIDAPTLIVTRRTNSSHGPGHGAYLASHIRNATVLELPGEGVGNFFGAEPEEAAEIQDFLTGTRADPEPARTLAAILFTDLVQSTQSVVETGDRRWRDVLDHHDAVIALQVKRFGGRVVKQTGDGALVTFVSPLNALRCAWAIRGELRVVGLDTRAGVHVGEIELRGDDIAGIAVHIAERITSSARGGDVVSSQVVTEVLSGTGVVFERCSQRTLRGLPGHWVVYRAEPAAAITPPQ